MNDLREFRSLENGGPAFQPRVLVATGEGEVLGLSTGVELDPDLAPLARLGGSALATALVLGELRRGGDEAPLVFAVGAAVRRGLPTADRLTVAGVGALGGRYVDGQLGGGAARRMARHLDALVLRGALEGGPWTLVVDAEGGVSSRRLASLDALDTPARARALREFFPGAAGLVVGPAAEAGVPFAGVANLADPPSFSGRGGLGARMAKAGLIAVVFLAEPVGPSTEAEALRLELLRSPRLAARGVGGTLELGGLFEASGDVEPGRVLPAEDGAPSQERQACAGCPTACRHVATGRGGRRQGPRFSAVHALQARLELERPEEAFELLSTCDELGVDAREAGAALELWARTRPGVAFAELDSVLRDLERGEASPLFHGPLEVARAAGLEEATRTVDGLTARDVSSVASVLGQCASARGADPMRAFPFSVESGGDLRTLSSLLAPLELGERALDPSSPEGKGRLVWWHENLAAVVDASGFCAFSAAGLLVDGVWDLERLARVLAPEVEGARAWQALGASIVLAQFELADRLGGKQLRPRWAAARLDLPGVWDEYAVLRGLDARARPSAEARSRFGRAELLELGHAELASLDGASVEAEGGPRATGRVRLRAFGGLRGALTQELELELPAPLDELRARLERDHESLKELLRVATWSRAGERLLDSRLVRDGDLLDVGVALSGG